MTSVQARSVHGVLQHYSMHKSGDHIGDHLRINRTYSCCLLKIHQNTLPILYIINHNVLLQNLFMNAQDWSIIYVRTSGTGWSEPNKKKQMKIFSFHNIMYTLLYIHYMIIIQTITNGLLKRTCIQNADMHIQIRRYYCIITQIDMIQF